MSEKREGASMLTFTAITPEALSILQAEGIHPDGLSIRFPSGTVIPSFHPLDLIILPSKASLRVTRDDRLEAPRSLQDVR